MIEQSRLTQRSPFGAFVGIVATLVPRFRTKPLTLKYGTNRAAGTAAGYLGTVNSEHFNCEALSVSFLPAENPGNRLEIIKNR